MIGSCRPVHTRVFEIEKLRSDVHRFSIYGQLTRVKKAAPLYCVLLFHLDLFYKRPFI